MCSTSECACQRTDVRFDSSRKQTMKRTSRSRPTVLHTCCTSDWHSASSYRHRLSDAVTSSSSSSSSCIHKLYNISSNCSNYTDYSGTRDVVHWLNNDCAQRFTSLLTQNSSVLETLCGHLNKCAIETLLILALYRSFVCLFQTCITS